MAVSQEEIARLMGLLPEKARYDPKKQQLLEGASRLHKPPAKILAGIFTAVALTSVASRLYIQLSRRGKLFLDDYLVLVATCSLIIETGLWFHTSDTLWVVGALADDMANDMKYFDRSEVFAIQQFIKINNAYLVFVWLTNYVIKVSFLAFFRGLLRNLGKGLTMYWWFVLVVVLASWVFNTIISFAICGVGVSSKCFPDPPYKFEIRGTSTAADILTDILIVSIPILVLRKSQMRFTQKLRILVFLCLSLFMGAFALTHMLGALYRDERGKLTISVTWAHTWLYYESCAAVTLGGLTAFRTIFASHAREAGVQSRRSNNTSSGTLHDRFRGFFDRLRGDSGPVYDKDGASNHNAWLSGPATGGTRSGLRTSIRRHARNPGFAEDDANDSILHSKYAPIESDHGKDVHAGANPGSGSQSDMRKTFEAEDIELISRPPHALSSHNGI